MWSINFETAYLKISYDDVGEFLEPQRRSSTLSCPPLGTYLRQSPKRFPLLLLGGRQHACIRLCAVCVRHSPRRFPLLLFTFCGTQRRAYTTVCCGYLQFTFLIVYLPKCKVNYKETVLLLLLFWVLIPCKDLLKGMMAVIGYIHLIWLIIFVFTFRHKYRRICRSICIRK